MKSKTLGMMIAECRKKQGMTQLDLAKEMGVTDKAVSKWERDLSCPDVNSFPHLAKVLEVTINELMQCEAEAAPKSKDVSAIVTLIFRSVAMAMGIAVVVLSILDALEADTGILLLGIGLTSLAVDAIRGNV